MRIRKNASHSSLMFSPAASRTETHVCQLNQSPWDVIPFTLQTYQSYLLQHDGAEDSFNGNGSLGDSINGVESNSVASLMEDDDDPLKFDNMAVEDDNCENKRMFEGFKFKSKKAVKKTDGKQLRHFKNEVKEEDSMWDYQLKTRTSNSNVSSCNGVNVNGNDCNGVKKPEKAQAPVGARRGRGKGVKKGQSSTSSNPYEFYYYSGFGPLWGKRRGEGNSNKGKQSDNTTSFLAPSPPIEDHFDEFDFIDDDDDDSENGEFGKKRMRKPVKARSLKSLM